MLWLVPSAVSDVGLATNVVFVPLGLPATKVTAALAVALAAVAVTVLTSAVVEASVAVSAPCALVRPDEGLNVLLVPVETSCTVWSGTALP